QPPVPRIDGMCATIGLPRGLTVQMDSVGIRSANPYLATPGTTVHGHYGEILSEGDILVTFIYQK
ncbi:hypothetical protein KC217_21730, partial [Mycobacterium tuberculosis]|nr:hypothetical protein [Mycobacterium tuberculosis]